MDIDALDPCVTRPSAAMTLTMPDKQVPVFHEDIFQLLLPSQFCEMIENVNIYIYIFFQNSIQHIKS